MLPAACFGTDIDLLLRPKTKKGAGAKTDMCARFSSANEARQEQKIRGDVYVRIIIQNAE